MYQATFQLEGVTDLMFGRQVIEAKGDNETFEQFELRTWKQKVWTNGDGQCYCNPFAITNGLVSAAQWLKRKVPGEGRATFTARFRSGVNPHSKLLLFKKGGEVLTIDDVEPVPLSVPSDGVHGGAKRVTRIFPTVHEWVMRGDVLIIDGKITEDIFSDHLTCAGRFVGFGPMRAGNGGVNGRFLVDKLTFEPLEV